MIYDYESYRGYLDEDKSILRDPRGVQRTETLFHGMNKREEKYPSIYSLSESERNGLPSAYQIYIHSIDEREAALKLFGSLKHWRKMVKLKWFLEGDLRFGHDGVIRWREDMALRDISLAKSILIANAKKGDTSAARKLLDEYKGMVPSNKVGRPKNGETVAPVGLFDANKIAQIHSKRFGE